MKLLLALFDLFRKGSAVADPAAWKYGQITVTVLAAALWSLVRFLASAGFAIPIDETQVDQLAAGILVLVNVVLTLVTSDKIGLPARTQADDQPGGQQPPSILDTRGG